jgi:hypothetical protein
MLKISVVVLAGLAGLLAASPAEAKCSLVGKWDMYLVLEDNRHDIGAAPVPYPISCKLWIDKDGFIFHSLCRGGFEIVDSKQLQATKGCRLPPGAAIDFAGEVEFFCDVGGTMTERGEAVHGLADCGIVAAPLALVRRSRGLKGAPAGGAATGGRVIHERNVTDGIGLDG